ncbi:MAG: type II toxin-antitoxin system VapC family toxin [Rhodocyclaceae bacterium]|nr:type II toxin-antitoxin system VapC family toxin [Rhodocyclaceae bacterium]
MTGSSLYVDTSALLKWYLQEPFSDEFSDFIRNRPGARISSLSVTEVHCTLARLTRNRDLSASFAAEVVAAFSAQTTAGYLCLLPIHDEYLAHATELVDSLKQPLRTLDALHLAVAHAKGCKEFATADKIQAKAARALGLNVHTFY